MFSAAPGLTSGGNSWSNPSFAHMGFHPGLPSVAAPNDVVHETGGLSDLLRLQLSYYDLGELDHFLTSRLSHLAVYPDGAAYRSFGADLTGALLL